METLESKVISNVSDTMDIQQEALVSEGENAAVSSLLRKVYAEEVGYGNIEPNQATYKLLIIAVHAAFLESGFVCVDVLRKKKIDGVCLPQGWGLKSSVSLQYTLPLLLNHGLEEVVDLKFHTLGQFVCVHGRLSKGNPVAFFHFDLPRFVPSINFVCRENCHAVGGKEEVDSNAKSNHEKAVFELCKIAKDRLALPLLIDLCVKTGLEPPPCFMCLPTDLKLKILEFIPGIDLARVGRVSRELKHLSSNNHLWKQKCLEEFPQSHFGEILKDRWKDKYAVCRERISRKRRPPAPLQYPPIPRPFPTPFFGNPGIIGGDQDPFPAPFGRNNQILRFPARRNPFIPDCDITWL